MDPTDQELVSRANAGDAAAFDQLYRRHRDWVLALALRFTGDSDRAQDVMQDVFLYLLGKFPGLVLTCELRTLLYPATRNLAIQRLRRDRRELLDDDVIGALPAATPGRSADAEVLARALAPLPPAQREVLLLRFVADLPLQEIAVALAIPLGTVKSRLHIALDRLRQDPALRELLQ